MRHPFQRVSFDDPQHTLPIGINSYGLCVNCISHTHPCEHHVTAKLIKYACNWLDHQPTYRVPPTVVGLPPANFPVPDRETHKLIMPRKQANGDNPKARPAKSFHAPSTRTVDPRKTRTVRSTTTPRGKILALQLCTTPVVSILVLPKKTPANALITAHTAANAHGHWRGVATSVELPASITLPCHASELDSRLLRVCVFGGRREIGDFVIPVRSVLEGGACVGVGKRGVLDVRGVVGSYNGYGLGIGLCAGLSVFKEVRGCLMRVKRVGGGRKDVPLGEWGFGREASCRINIVGEVLWFGIEQTDGSVVRLVFQVVRKGRFGGEEIVGEMQVGLQEIANVTKGQLLKVAWWRGGVSLALLAVVEMTRSSVGGQVLLELRLTR